MLSSLFVGAEVELIEHALDPAVKELARQGGCPGLPRERLEGAVSRRESSKTGFCLADCTGATRSSSDLSALDLLQPVRWCSLLLERNAQWYQLCNALLCRGLCSRRTSNTSCLPRIFAVQVFKLQFDTVIIDAASRQDCNRLVDASFRESLMEVLGDTITSNFPELVVQDISRALSARTGVRLVDVLIRDPSKVFIAENSRRSRSWFNIMQQPTAACVVLHADNFLALPASQVLGLGLAAQLRRFFNEHAASAPCCVCLDTKATSGTCSR